ncbi:ABC transporter ATP-binding protein [Leminorella grimontii]|uniref:ABC transporter ATP-binding protein n=1 Tax=Leminorella grimontii TaxID=82981 RepID=UPI00321F7DB7
MSELIVKGLKVHFNGSAQPALHIPSLTVTSGSHIAVTGASGSGKTTLVNAVSGLERSPVGQIFWDGQDIGGLSESVRDDWRARRVGLIMQDFHLYPGLSALDNVLLPTRFRAWRTPIGLKARASALLDRVGIYRENQPVDTLSRGEKQRVAIARALLSSPSILIADEPTASLDEENGRRVIQLLTQFAKEGRSTLICVTHDARLSSRMQRAIVLENGRVQSDVKMEKAT